MVKLLNLNGLFRGTASEDATLQLMNFVATYKSIEIP